MDAQRPFVSGAVETVYFAAGSGTAYGRFHGVREPRGVGLVWCNAFGYEALCSFRTVLRIAQRASGAGVPSLRFDYPGTGDAADPDEGRGGLAAWIVAVHSAIDRLRETSGVERVVLGGIRLGASIAMRAAASRGVAAAVGAGAPGRSGRGYLRELAALQSAFLGGIPAVPAGAEAEALGFGLPDTLRADLAALDLSSAGDVAGRRVLAFERTGFRLPAKFTAAAREAGATLTVLPADGYDEMLLDPHRSVVPGRIVESVVDFVTDVARAGPRAASGRPSSIVRAADGVLAPARGILESDVPAESIAGLYAISTRPSVAKPRRVLLLPNAGSIHHVGPNRMYVHWARRLAARGAVVVRFDVGGLGESPTPVGGVENETYPAHGVDDVRTLVRWARTEYPGVPLAIAGICSGAYHALHAAAREDGIERVLVINPLTYFWDYERGVAVGELGTSQAAVRHAAAGPWAKRIPGLLTDPGRAQRALRFVARRLRQRAAGWGTDALRSVGIRTRFDLPGLFDDVLARGGRIQLIFAAEDPGRDLLALQGGRRAARLIARGDVGVRVIDGPDHTFTCIEHQRLLSVALDDALADRDGRDETRDVALAH